jgi:hypothetical protein
MAAAISDFPRFLWQKILGRGFARVGAWFLTYMQ